MSSSPTTAPARGACAGTRAENLKPHLRRGRARTTSSASAQHLFEAATNAQQTQSLAPLRAFVRSWAVFVAIERHPGQAARLRELERLVDAGEADPTEAITEIGQIRTAAQAEAGL